MKRKCDKPCLSFSGNKILSRLKTNSIDPAFCLIYRGSILYPCKVLTLGYFQRFEQQRDPEHCTRRIQKPQIPHIAVSIGENI